MAGFAEQAGEIGTGIGAFLTPIIGGKETTTTTPNASPSGNKTPIIVAGIVLLLIVAFLVFKPTAS